jgi:hypothetical protein
MTGQNWPRRQAALFSSARQNGAVLPSRRKEENDTMLMQETDIHDFARQLGSRDIGDGSE